MAIWSSFLTAILASAMIYGQLFVPREPPPLTGAIDRIVVEKSTRRMILYRDDMALRVYRIALGFAPEGDKEREGDGKTPEGIFRIDRKNPESKFYLSLGLDYPHEEDLVRASTGGYSAGGDIFIHGQPKGVSGEQWINYDWTAGCIAVSNAIMDELWPVIEVGTVVEVRP